MTCSMSFDAAETTHHAPEADCGAESTHSRSPVNARNVAPEALVYFATIAFISSSMLIYPYVLPDKTARMLPRILRNAATRYGRGAIREVPRSKYHA